MDLHRERHRICKLGWSWRTSRGQRRPSVQQETNWGLQPHSEGWQRHTFTKTKEMDTWKPTGNILILILALNADIHQSAVWLDRKWRLIHAIISLYNTTHIAFICGVIWSYLCFTNKQIIEVSHVTAANHTRDATSCLTPADLQQRVNQVRPRWDTHAWDNQLTVCLSALLALMGFLSAQPYKTTCATLCVFETLCVCLCFLRETKRVALYVCVCVCVSRGRRRVSLWAEVSVQLWETNSGLDHSLSLWEESKRDAGKLTHTMQSDCRNAHKPLWRLGVKVSHSLIPDQGPLHECVKPGARWQQWVRARALCRWGFHTRSSSRRRLPGTAIPPQAPNPRPHPAGRHTPRCLSRPSRVCAGHWAPRPPPRVSPAWAAPEPRPPQSGCWELGCPEETLSREEGALVGGRSLPHSRVAYSLSRTLKVMDTNGSECCSTWPK